MCTIDDTIRQVLSICRSEPRASTQDKHGPILLDLHEEYKDDTKEKLEADMRKFMNDQKVNFSVVEYASINKMLALCSLTVIIVYIRCIIITIFCLFNQHFIWCLFTFKALQYLLCNNNRF